MSEENRRREGTLFSSVGNSEGNGNLELVYDPPRVHRDCNDRGTCMMPDHEVARSHKHKVIISNAREVSK